MIDNLTFRELQDQDGVSAFFRTRADADLAIEHLVQEYGLDPAFILVEPAREENSVGIEISGGDHASDMPSHGDRHDAPLHGAIHLTVQFEHGHLADVKKALADCRVLNAEAF